jgi:hypothetical protein
MAFVEKAKEYLDAGVRVSKDMLTKAGGAVQEMSDKGVLKLEITQLKSKRKKAFENLGAAVYNALNVQGAKSITAKTAAAAPIIEEIVRLDEQIDAKTQEFDALSAKDPDIASKNKR